MTKALDIEASEWLHRAECLAPIIERYREEGERERMLPPDVFAAMRDADLFDMWLPMRYGGYEVDNETRVRVVEKVASSDGAAGWNLFITGAGGLLASYLPRATADEIFIDAVLAGALAPTGKAERVSGGHRLTGRWSFASGCQHANWLVAGAVTDNEGKPVLRAEGRPEIKIYFVPAADCQILDTWYTAGLRGTGSHDFVVKDVFVPEGREFLFDDLFAPPIASPATPPFHHLAIPGLAAVALGIARDSIDTLKYAAMTKTPCGGTQTLLTYQTIHDRVGRAEAMLSAARAYLVETVRRVASFAGDDNREDNLALVRLAGTHAAQTAADVANLMFNAGGGSAVYATSRLERCFRDANTLTHHFMVQSMNYEMVGQYLLGLGLQTRR